MRSWRHASFIRYLGEEEIQMKSFKRLLVAWMAVVMMFAGTVIVSQAASSPEKVSIVKTSIKATTVKYNGKNQKPVITVKYGNALLEAGTDYKVTYAKTYKNAGTYTVKVTGKGRFDGTKTVKYTIKGTATTAKNKVTVKAAKTSAKASTLKKKKQTIKLTVKKGSSANKGAVTYTVTKGSSKYISVSKKGVVTLKKGAVKGTYKVQVSVAGYKQFDPVAKTVTITVK
jgi:lipopolysaccharide export LptBFGC system permease protein LptF